MIRAESLSKRFEHISAVKDVSFDIPKGEIIGLIGPNGAGKTTSVRMLTGILKPSGGNAWVHERSIRNGIEKIREVLGVVPESVNLYRRMTARETIRFFGQVYGVPFPQLDSRINELAKRLDLGSHLDRPNEGLSLGTKKKVQFATALVHDPQVLICDEPTLALDPRAKLTIAETLEKLREDGKTILVTSHNMDLVDRICNQVAVICNGQIRAIGTPSQLKSSLGDTQSGKEVTLDDVFLHYTN